MSSAPIWALDAAAARAAGWRRADCLWESLQARAKALQLAGGSWRPAGLWLAGWGLGLLALPAADPRRIAGLANAGHALRRLGAGRAGRALEREAGRRWPAAAARLATLTIAPRTRSSLFHLRLASRHGSAYADRIRAELMALHREAGGWLAAARPEPGEAGEVGEAACRWVVERPPVYDDSRLFVAACCLLACAQPRSDPALGSVADPA